MPELPEVETTLRGLEPVLTRQKLAGAVVRERRLRWPIARNLNSLVRGQRVLGLRRRAKYLLVELERGHLLWHLGMSGSFRVVPPSLPAELHDHVDFLIADGPTVRFNDPRRFGSIHYVRGDPAEHRLLSQLGPEPLADEFDGHYLWTAAVNRKVAIKALLMNSHIVVGVGNIYANEALFHAEIHPQRAAGKISLKRMQRLANCVKQVLEQGNRTGGNYPQGFHRRRWPARLFPAISSGLWAGRVNPAVFVGDPYG